MVQIVLYAPGDQVAYLVTHLLECISNYTVKGPFELTEFLLVVRRYLGTN